MARTFSASQFELLEELGRGSFGVVYKARDKITNNVVAIKQIDLESSDEDINEIQKEIAILSTCDFPQIVRYYGCYVNKYKLSIIMELLTGGSCLDMLVHINSFSENEIAIICRELLQALQYLHSNHKIHRDIKAANVLVDESTGNVKVVDFGVATQLSNNMSRRNTFVGTPFWMSPEVILQHDYNYKTDIWSLGITAIELALGKPPLANIHPLKVLFLIPKNPAPTLPTKSPHTSETYSQNFHSFVKQCLQKNPGVRPSAKSLMNHPFIKGAGKNSDLLTAVKKSNEICRGIKAAAAANENKSKSKPIAIPSRAATNQISFDLDDSTIKKTSSRSSSGSSQNSQMSKKVSPTSSTSDFSPPKSSRSKSPSKHSPRTHTRSKSATPQTPKTELKSDSKKHRRSFQSSASRSNPRFNHGHGSSERKISLFDFELMGTPTPSHAIDSSRMSSPIKRTTHFGSICNQALSNQPGSAKLDQLNSLLCDLSQNEVPMLCDYFKSIISITERSKDSSQESLELYQRIVPKTLREGKTTPRVKDNVEELLLSRWAEGVLERWNDGS